MELKLRVEQISAAVDELRQVAVEGGNTRSLIDSIFRSVHSLKAAAATDGFTELSRVAHEFENLLHSLRTGKARLNDEVFQVFTETRDALVSTLDTDHQAPTSVLRRLNEVSANGSDIELTRPIPAEFLSSLRDEERHQLAESLKEGSNLYLLEVEFDVSDFDLQFRRLREQLKETGEVISTTAKVDEDRRDKIRFRILYTAKVEIGRLSDVVQQAVRAGQSVAAALGKEIEFVIRGGDLLLDRSVYEALADPLLHLVRNAVDHGIESHGKVTIEVRTIQGTLQILVSDDGRGIDPANLPRLFEPGFSTAVEVSEISGRGVGLDVVKTAIEAAGGTVNVTSQPGKGSSFAISLPLD